MHIQMYWYSVRPSNTPSQSPRAWCTQKTSPSTCLGVPERFETLARIPTLYHLDNSLYIRPIDLLSPYAFRPPQCSPLKQEMQMPAIMVAEGVQVANNGINRGVGNRVSAGGKCMIAWDGYAQGSLFLDLRTQFSVSYVSQVLVTSLVVS